MKTSERFYIQLSALSGASIATRPECSFDIAKIWKMFSITITTGTTFYLLIFALVRGPKKRTFPPRSSFFPFYPQADLVYRHAPTSSDELVILRRLNAVLVDQVVRPDPQGRECVSQYFGSACRWIRQLKKKCNILISCTWVLSFHSQSIHSSSRSTDLVPPPSKLLNKLCFGGSGISRGKNSSPTNSDISRLKTNITFAFSTTSIHSLRSAEIHTKNLQTRWIAELRWETKSTNHDHGYWSRKSLRFCKMSKNKHSYSRKNITKFNDRK